MVTRLAEMITDLVDEWPSCKKSPHLLCRDRLSSYCPQGLLDDILPVHQPSLTAPLDLMHQEIRGTGGKMVSVELFDRNSAVRIPRRPYRFNRLFQANNAVECY